MINTLCVATGQRSVPGGRGGEGKSEKKKKWRWAVDVTYRYGNRGYEEERKNAASIDRVSVILA